MISNYAEFGINSNSDISEVVNKLAKYLSRTHKKASRLSSQEEKERILLPALKTVENVCRIISSPKSKHRLPNQMDTSTVISNEKMGVQPLSRWRIKSKASWLRILHYLLSTITNERKMFFLREQDDIEGILDFIIESTSSYSFEHHSFENTYYISWDIIKRSFDMASLRERSNVKLEDILASINKCEHLDTCWRTDLATAIFDRWFESSTYSKQ
ncbi:MAG: hypothetical protein PHS98_02570 [Bacilli bacterium]|nr:hypothetical protein [Bacilli bacterium]